MDHQETYLELQGRYLREASSGNSRSSSQKQQPYNALEDDEEARDPYYKEAYRTDLIKKWSTGLIMVTGGVIAYVGLPVLATAAVYIAIALAPTLYFADRWRKTHGIDLGFSVNTGLAAEVSMGALGASIAWMFMTAGLVNTTSTVSAGAMWFLSNIFSAVVNPSFIQQGATLLISPQYAFLAMASIGAAWLVPAMFVAKSLYGQGYQKTGLAVGIGNVLAVAAFIALGLTPVGLAVLGLAVVLTMSAWIFPQDTNKAGQGWFQKWSAPLNVGAALFAVGAFTGLAVSGIFLMPLALTVLGTTLMFAKKCYYRAIAKAEPMELKEPEHVFKGQGRQTKRHAQLSLFGNTDFYDAQSEQELGEWLSSQNPVPAALIIRPLGSGLGR